MSTHSTQAEVDPIETAFKRRLAVSNMGHNQLHELKKAEHEARFGPVGGIPEVVAQMTGVVAKPEVAAKPKTLKTEDELAEMFAKMTPERRDAYENAVYRARLEAESNAAWLDSSGYHTIPYDDSDELDLDEYGQPILDDDQYAGH